MNKLTKIVVVILSSFLVFSMAFLITYPSSILKWTDKVVREELNNPYIKSDSAGWKKVYLDRGTSIQIPGDWELLQEGDRLVLTKGKTVMARGARVLRGDPEAADKGLAEQKRLYPFPVHERTLEDLTVANLGTGASYLAITCRSERGEQETHYVLFLSYSQEYEYFLDFGTLDGIEDPRFDYITAMAFSYDFSEDTERQADG